MNSRRKQEIKEAAKDMIKDPVDLIEHVLYKHMEALLEELNDQLRKKKDWATTLNQMSEAMAEHELWKKQVVGTPLENDLPVIAAKVALKS